MDKQTTGWWIPLAFSLKLAIFCRWLATNSPLLGVRWTVWPCGHPCASFLSYRPVDRAFVGRRLSLLSLSSPFDPFFLFLFFFPWLHSTHTSPQSILPPSFLVTFFLYRAGVGFTLSAVHLAVHSFSITSPSIVSCNPVFSDRPTDLIHSLFFCLERTTTITI
ncbi:hypothetical protein BDV40DRAFT_121144 [Aspergillus tamarii]|uniref:Uncharacterized protein n=1 Tax=Aspergillus tamarii TaxID=41984 RepID=A0A5N6UZY4_ASPTM|nr:hypothetical protein BDV40DRAFT_121144 [Aspergillus tamarii]